MDRFSKFFEQFQFVGPCRTETSFENVVLQRGINFIDSIDSGTVIHKCRKKKKNEKFQAPIVDYPSWKMIKLK